jgi:hypothetical protein
VRELQGIKFAMIIFLAAHWVCPTFPIAHPSRSARLVWLSRSIPVVSIETISLCESDFAAAWVIGEPAFISHPSHRNHRVSVPLSNRP